MPACGLDFGTSNSAVALASGEVLRLEPASEAPRLARSVLFFPEDTGETLAGGEAIERYLQDNAGRFIQSMKTWLPATSFVHTQIRGRTLTLEQLIAIFLRNLRKQASVACGRELDEVVLGRPRAGSPSGAAWCRRGRSSPSPTPCPRRRESAASRRARARRW